MHLASLRPTRVHRSAFGVLLASLALFACGGDKSSNPEDPKGSVTLTLSYTVDGQPVVWSSSDYRYVNAAGNHYKVIALRHYISGVKLKRVDGSAFSSADVHLLKSNDPSTLSFTIGDVPSGPYSGIEFNVGLDDLKNVDGGLPNTVDNFNMQWPDQLGGGYHNMQMEGRYLAGSADSTWAVHLGKVKHDPSETFYHNHFAAIVLAGSGLEVAGDAWDVSIAMDINQWFATPTTYDFLDYGAYIMENHEAQEILVSNARDAFTVTSKVRR